MAWPGPRLFYTSCMWARGRVCDGEQGLKRDGEEGSLLVGCMKRAVGVTSCYNHHCSKQLYENPLALFYTLFNIVAGTVFFSHYCFQ